MKGHCLLKEEILDEGMRPFSPSHLFMVLIMQLNCKCKSAIIHQVSIIVFLSELETEHCQDYCKEQQPLCNFTLFATNRRRNSRRRRDVNLELLVFTASAPFPAVVDCIGRLFMKAVARVL